MDSLDELFEKARMETERIPPKAGHIDRFLFKLEAVSTRPKKKIRWWYAAASVLLVIGLASLFTPVSNKADLADVSPEMQSTEQFFRQTIIAELDRLQDMPTDSVTVKLIEDALQQMKILEIEYENLRKELKLSGYDKRVVYAMIANFQQRIDLLQEVLSEIERIKNIKSNAHDTV